MHPQVAIPISTLHISLAIPQLAGAHSWHADCINQGMNTKESVLLFGDEDHFLEVLSIALGFHGLQVQRATTANKMWQLHGEQEFDLIITDIDMPLMDRVKFMSSIRKAKPEQRMILLSSYPEDWGPWKGESVSSMLKKTGLKEPGVRVLGKPFRLDELFGAINELCGGDVGSVSQPLLSGVGYQGRAG